MATHFANELYFLPLYKPISFNNMRFFIIYNDPESSRIQLGWLSPNSSMQRAPCHFNGMWCTGEKLVPAVTETPGSGYSGVKRGRKQGELKGLDSAKISQLGAQLWLHVWRNCHRGETQTEHVETLKLDCKFSCGFFGEPANNNAFFLSSLEVSCFFYQRYLFVHPTRHVYLRTNPAMVWGKGMKKCDWNGSPSHHKHSLWIWIRKAVNRRSFCSVPFPAISLFIEGSWKRGGAFFSLS